MVAAVVAALMTAVGLPGQAADAGPTVSFGLFGDSFSAGEGLPNVDPREEQCQRAPGNDGRSTAWGVQVMRDMSGRLGSSGKSWLAACTGAQSRHFAGPVQPDRGRDKNQLREARDGTGLQQFDVALASFGINDLAAYDPKMERSMELLVADCIGVDEAIIGGTLGGPHNWFGGAALGFVLGRCRRDLDGVLRRHLDARVRQNLHELYDRIGEATTSGGLVAIGGYPQFFEDPGAWPRFNKLTNRCQMFHEDDVKMFRGVIGRLNQVLSEEVDAARSRHPGQTWVFADVSKEFKNHGLCTSSGEQWLNGITVWPRFKRSYHPTQEGQNGYARAVLSEGSLKKWAGASPGNTTGATLPPGRSVASATSLVMDVSSSMEEDAGGSSGSKIDAAIRAAQDIVGIAEAENSAGGSHGVGLIEFSTSADVLAPSTPNLTSLRLPIAALRPQDSTNIGAGLDLGIQQLSGASGPKTLVLLSDGKTNQGLTSDEVLSTIAPRARAEGIRIFAVGFGTGQEIDESLLRSLASDSGGGYSMAQTPLALRLALMEARHTSLGTVVGRAQGQVGQGQSVDAATFAVPAKKEELLVSLAWPGSDLDPVLVDPAGRTVDERYSGARLFRDQNPEIAIIDQPDDGDWTLKVEGKDVSGLAEDYVGIASTRGDALIAEPGSGPGLLLPVLGSGAALLLLGGGVGYAGMRRRRGAIRSCSRCGSAFDERGACPRCDRSTDRATLDLRVLDGESSGAVLQLESGHVIGRGEGANHWLADETVSRRHAEVLWAEGAWAVLDLGSTSGTFRNGEPVLRAHLQVGDVLTLGLVNLRVESTGRG